MKQQKKPWEIKNYVRLLSRLTKTVKENMGVDWSKRDSAKAKMRVAVRRLLKNMAIHQIYKNGCRAGCRAKQNLWRVINKK